MMESQNAAPQVQKENGDLPGEKLASAFADLLSQLFAFLLLLLSFAKETIVLWLKAQFDRITAPLLNYALPLLHITLKAATTPASDQLATNVKLPGVHENNQVTEKTAPLDIILQRDFFRSIVVNDIDTVSRLLKHSSWLCAARHDLGWYPIHSAVLTGNIDMVKLMLSQKTIEVNIRDETVLDSPTEANVESRKRELSPRIVPDLYTEGATALHFACLIGDLPIIEALFEAGAIRNAEDQIYRHPAAYFGTNTPTSVLESYGDLNRKAQRRDVAMMARDVTTLCWLLKENMVEDCKRLLEWKPELASYAHPNGWYPIHVAVAAEEPDLVTIILSHLKPYDLSKRDNCQIPDNWGCRKDFCISNNQARRNWVGCTALHYACLLGNMQIIEQLITAGADYDVEDSMQHKAIDYIDPRRQDLLHRFAQLCETKPKEVKDVQTSPSSPQGSIRLGSGTDSESEDVDEQIETLPKYIRDNPIEAFLGSKIVGQMGPIRSAASAINMRANGWIDPNKPLVMLFTGSSGVGKTELAKQIALYLQRDPSKSIDEIEGDGSFIRVDMTEFREAHTVCNLTGSPKSFVGYEEGGVLTNKLRADPDAIVLLEEIEKAHPKVLTLFLQVFDDGRISDSKHGTIHCKDAIFIMTSNLGSKAIRHVSPQLRRLVEETQDRPQDYTRRMGVFNRKIYPILKAGLKRDEFLGRIHQIVVFLPLNTEEIAQVIEIELVKWRHRAAGAHQVRISWSREVVLKLGESYDVNYGARSIINETHRVAVRLVAEAHIRGEIGSNWHVRLLLDSAGNISMKTIDSTKAEVRERRGCRYML